MDVWRYFRTTRVGKRRWHWFSEQTGHNLAYDLAASEHALVPVCHRYCRCLDEWPHRARSSGHCRADQSGPDGVHGLVIAASSGAVAAISQSFGAGKGVRARRYVALVVYGCIGFGVVLALVAWAARSPFCVCCKRRTPCCPRPRSFSVPIWQACRDNMCCPLERSIPGRKIGQKTALCFPVRGCCQYLRRSGLRSGLVGLSLLWGRGCCLEHGGGCLAWGGPAAARGLAAARSAVLALDSGRSAISDQGGQARAGHFAALADWLYGLAGADRDPAARVRQRPGRTDSRIAD